MALKLSTQLNVTGAIRKRVIFLRRVQSMLINLTLSALDFENLEKSFYEQGIASDKEKEEKK